MPKVSSDRPKQQVAPPESAASQPRARGRSSLFKYYIHDHIDACRLQLIGELTESDVPELSGCWRTARTILGDRKLLVDLRKLKTVDEAGKQWILSMTDEGAACIPETFLRDVTVRSMSDAKETAAGRPSFFAKLLSVIRGSRVVAAE